MLQKLHIYFDSLDTKKEGEIDMEELSDIIICLGYKPPVRSSSTEKIKFDGFLNLVSKKQEDAAKKAKGIGDFFFGITLNRNCCR